MEHKNPSINFVSRTAINNGISDYVDAINSIPPYSSGCLTLAFGGSIGSCFVQTAPFYTGQNVGVIVFPEYVSYRAKIYIASILSKKCKLVFTAFNNEINKHFKTDLTINIPINEDLQPDYDYMDRYIRAIEKLIIKNVISYKDDIINQTREILNRN